MNPVKADVAIVGAGMAGATAAAMLGRAGIDTVLIDPHTEYRPDFRCEKLDHSQIELLRLTGLAEEILPHTCADREVWIVRYGRLIDRRPGGRAGIVYHDLVNATRRLIPSSVRQFHTKATAIDRVGEKSVVKLGTGEEISSRLTILATGLNPSLRSALGIEQRVLSPCHSVSLGFDMQPADRQGFKFPALTVFPDGPDQRLAYLSVFPVPGAMRANLFVYWAPDDKRLHKFRHHCREALLELIPNLCQFTGDFSINSHVSIRPVDLVRSTIPAQPGVVLVGDAYSTSCPAAGTGVDKVLTDVQRLCSVHIPEWLKNGAIGTAEVARFYADHKKVQCEARSYEKAIWLRQISTEKSLDWRCWRGARFLAQAAIGQSRAWRPAAVPLVDRPSGLPTGV